VTPRPIIQNATRTCTVPAHQSLLLDIGSIVDDYPCPDPAFQPPPGESLYDFLIADAKPVMDTVNALQVSIDGIQVPDVLSYRYRGAAAGDQPDCLPGGHVGVRLLPGPRWRRPAGLPGRSGPQQLVRLR
jgi:hypothetical protein